MQFKGSITDIKSRIDAMSNVIQRVTLEVHGDEFSQLHLLMRKPLIIKIIEEIQ
jgi:hypothetical protein